MKPSEFQRALVRVIKQSLCDFQRQLNPAERRHFAVKAEQAPPLWLMAVRAWHRLSHEGQVRLYSLVSQWGHSMSFRLLGTVLSWESHCKQNEGLMINVLFSHGS